MVNNSRVQFVLLVWFLHNKIKGKMFSVIYSCVFCEPDSL